MEINKELKHIAEYQNSILPRHQKRTEEAVEIIANDAIESLKNGTFDFKSFLHLDLNQNGKHRQVIMYKPFSPEELLCIFLKRVLDRKFHISYPNRMSIFVLYSTRPQQLKTCQIIRYSSLTSLIFLIVSPVNMFITSISRVLHLNDTKTS